MNLKTFSSIQYKVFCKAEGSQNIVSEYALLQILRLIKLYSIKSILEVGVGIGTISGSILKYFENVPHKLYCAGTEKNEFCLNEIPKNLGHNYKDLMIYPEINKVSGHSKFDLIIIDGAEKNLGMVKNLLTTKGIIVIEGDRRIQEEMVKNIFPSAKYVHLISLKRNGEYSVKYAKNFQGGLKVWFVNPDIKQKIHWGFLKLSTAMKFQIRKSLA
jgi:hypothetical protein